MRKYIRFFIIILTVLFLSGCATITTGPTQKVPVTSNPTGAFAKVDGAMAAVTPTIFTLERKSDHVVEISKQGYRTATVALKRALSGAVAGNLLIGGIIGVAIDSGTGAMYKLVPEKVHADLEQVGASGKKEATMSEVTKDVIKSRSGAQRAPASEEYLTQGISIEDRVERLKVLYRQGHISEQNYREELEIILQSE